MSKLVEDPFEKGFERTFLSAGQKGLVITRESFADYLDGLRYKMRECLDKSEKARDTYYMIRQAYEKERGVRGIALDEAMKTNARAVAAVSDNVMYDRWAQKYAAVIQAEVAYASYTGWGTA